MQYGTIVTITTSSGVIHEGSIKTINGTHVALLTDGGRTFILPWVIIKKVEVIA